MGAADAGSTAATDTPPAPDAKSADAKDSKKGASKTPAKTPAKTPTKDKKK